MAHVGEEFRFCFVGGFRLVAGFGEFRCQFGQALAAGFEFTVVLLQFSVLTFELLGGFALFRDVLKRAENADGRTSCSHFALRHGPDASLRPICPDDARFELKRGGIFQRAAHCVIDDLLIVGVIDVHGMVEIGDKRVRLTVNAAHFGRPVERFGHDVVSPITDFDHSFRHEQQTVAFLKADGVFKNILFGLVAGSEFADGGGKFRRLTCCRFTREGITRLHPDIGAVFVQRPVRANRLGLTD